jgi:5-methyltetrahydropteroyltriglutamate--homocysteine methyltransferase
MFATSIAGSLPKPGWQFVPKHRRFPGTNCGLAPMVRDVALRKLEAPARGAELARRKAG